MRDFASKWFPDRAWYFYLWAANENGARDRYPSLRRFIAFRRRLHSHMWQS